MIPSDTARRFDHTRRTCKKAEEIEEPEKDTVVSKIKGLSEAIWALDLLGTLALNRALRAAARVCGILYGRRGASNHDGLAD